MSEFIQVETPTVTRAALEPLLTVLGLTFDDLILEIQIGLDAVTATLLSLDEDGRLYITEGDDVATHVLSFPADFISAGTPIYDALLTEQRAA